MFTEIKKGKWNYMFLAAMASIALAVLATLFSAKSFGAIDERANQDNDQFVNDRYSQYNESVTRFIN